MLLEALNKLSGKVSTVALMAGSGQLDGAEDLLEWNLGATVAVKGQASALDVPLIVALDCLIRKLTLPLAAGERVTSVALHFK